MFEKKPLVTVAFLTLALAGVLWIRFQINARVAKPDRVEGTVNVAPRTPATRP